MLRGAGLGQPHRVDRSGQRSRGGAALDRPQAGAGIRRTPAGCTQEMNLDYSAVPKMPDGHTAAEHILAIEATSRAVRMPMGNGGRMMWHVWGERSCKPILLLFHCGSGSPIHSIRNVPSLSQPFTVFAADHPRPSDHAPPADLAPAS